MTAPTHLSDDDDQTPALAVAPAPARRQPGHAAELWLENATEPITVHITNRERIAYEKTAARHPEWPTMDQGQNFAMTFCCWAAAKRAGHTALGFDAFAEVLLDWDLIEEPADPTR